MFGRLVAPKGLKSRLDMLPGEKLVAWGSGLRTSGTDAAYVAATNHAVYVESVGERIPWDRISRAQWDEPMLELVVLDGTGQPSRLVSVPLDQANGVPAAVHAQVTQSVIASERLDLGDGAGAVAVARRSMDSDSIWWSVVFDSGLDHADPALRMRADAALGALRDSLGV
jgi:hypothetical protein